MRHFLHTRVFAAPAPVAALALGVTVPAASRVLISASRRAQRFTPGEAAAACPAVLLAPVAARADEHLAPASGTQKQSGIVHCSPRRGGLDDPRLPGNTALGAVRQCGSGRSLGRDRQVSTVRGCVSLLAETDLTPTHERRHRSCARCARAMAGSMVQGGNNDTSQAGTPGRFRAGALRSVQSVHMACSPNNCASTQPPTPPPAHSGEADHRIRCQADHPVRSSRSPVGAKRRGGSIMPFSDRLGSMELSSFAWSLL